MTRRTRSEIQVLQSVRKRAVRRVALVLMPTLLLTAALMFAPRGSVHSQSEPAPVGTPVLAVQAPSLPLLLGVDEADLRMLRAAGDAPLSAAQIREAEELSARFGTWIDEMQSVYPHLTGDPIPDQDQLLVELEQGLGRASDGDILLLGALYGDHPGFWELPALLEAALLPGGSAPPWYRGQIVEMVRRGEVTRESALALGVPAQALDDRIAGPSDDAVLPPGDALDSVPTPDATQAVPFPSMPQFPERGELPPEPDSRPGCPGAFGGDDCAACPDGIPLPAIFAVQSALTIASAVTSALDADIDAPIPPVCAVPTPIPNPAYYIANSVRVALGYTLNSLLFANELASNCQEGLHRALTNLYLDETMSSRVTQMSLDEHALLQLRVDIEFNLLRDADDRISLFQLPPTRCGSRIADSDPSVMTGFEGFAFCGKLDLVRQIVDETVRRNAAAGMLTDVNNALAELAAGDDHYMNGEWRSAYERYSTAYRLAVREER